jgi:DNA topoisomerase I
MAKSLVIVESPAKAKTINKFLGKSYVVKASMGHVRDLPKGKFGIDVDHDFAPLYQTIRGRGDALADLRKAAKGASMVYLAPDPDREGEAIAWHLKEALELPAKKTARVTFHEITKNAVKEAFDHATTISMDRVNAQQTRRILDRIVGYKLSPLLWEKITRGLSAGRVQSVAVRLIVEREREIRAFVPEEYWTIEARLSAGAGPSFLAELRRRDGEPVELKNAEQATAAYDEISRSDFVVDEVSKTKKTVKAPPPFTTSLLQQAASTRLRFSASRTMRIAQSLYEGVELGAEGSVGLITYMRTDSYNVSKEAIAAARELITTSHGKEYVPAEPNTFTQRKGAQLAHEAIRPTYLEHAPDKVAPHLTSDQLKLYKLIWARFLASQMSPAQFDLTDARIHAGRWQFTARGRRMIFPGHLAMSKGDEEDGMPELPPLEKGQKLKLEKLDKAQHFTQPPPRYSEATLVKALEKKGIGRPSTYASIISTIQARGYVKMQSRAFHATRLGEVVTELLVEHFPQLMDAEFTAGLETRLDEIEEAKTDWLDTLRAFWKTFTRDLEKATTAMRDYKKNPDLGEGEACEKCGSPMIIKLHPRGSFLACSAYPNCKNTRPLDPTEPKREAPQETSHVCSKCGSKMVLRSGRTGRFLACSSYPKCKNTFSVDEKGEPLIPKASGIKCDKCGAEMLIRYSRRGPFLGCSAYPACKNPKPLPEHLQPKPEPTHLNCEKCGKPMVIRAGRRGRFLACTGYPDCKETAPLEKLNLQPAAAPGAPGASPSDSPADVPEPTTDDRSE